MTLSSAHGAPTLKPVEAGESQESGARKRSGGHSGRLLLRMPESLHAELARASQREGVSLNGYIIDALSTAVRGRPAKPQPSANGRVADPAPRRRPLLERLLVVNLVVVAAVGVLVVVLLVQSLR
jgi:hypothetical protein